MLHQVSLKKLQPKKILITPVLLAMLSFVAVGCAHGYCYGKKDGVGRSATTIDTNERAFVFRPDGSKQCDPKSGESLESMAERLSDIKIYSKDKKSDGKMHMTLCGSPTGKINVYEIETKDLAKAQAASFQEFKHAN